MGGISREGLKHPEGREASRYYCGGISREGLKLAPGSAQRSSILAANLKRRIETHAIAAVVAWLYLVATSYGNLKRRIETNAHTRPWIAGKSPS